jgi:hypothetical protein
MKKIYTSGDMPLNTSNAALAFCLYIAGIPFLDEKQPLTQTFDAEILRKMGYKNTPIEKAVQLAFTAKQKGHVEYGFKRELRIGEAFGGFKLMESMIDSDAPAIELVRTMMERHAAGLLSKWEAISGATCAILKRWREELKVWEQQRRFAAQKHRNKVQNHDTLELATKVFLAGEPLAFMAVIMDGRTEFLKLSHRFPPVIRLRKDGKVDTVEIGKNRKLAKHPGFAFYTPDTDNSVRRHLGIPTR